ncbi:long-chain-fatty-acid--CoA ligase [Streptomyces sclerotialus]|uniref:long-chain-fatty-acid--CoA ligase n=1 Tax=Streptomyces sclerotialus TaxID=1957 RepID=UPI0004C55C19
MTTLSLATVLAEAARRRPGHLALVEGERRLTFGELWRQARTQAAALGKLGVRPGDKVALMAPNTAEFPRAYYAILAAGAVVVPVHLLLSAGEVAHVLRDSGAKLLLCHADQAATGGEAAAATDARMVTIGPEVRVPGADGRLEDLAETVEPLPTYVTREAEDPAVVFYTSGTTGVPKGAVLTHLSLVMNATTNAFDSHEVQPDDITLGALPLYHAFGQTASMNSTWRRGATLVLQPRFDAAAALDLMVRENVNTFQGVPTMYVRLLEAAGEAAALPRLERCVSGGASLPVPVLEKFTEVFDAEVYEGYGLSETSPTAAVNQPAFGTRAGTVGHAVWGVDVEIAAPEPADRVELLPAGELGEVVVRGHNVFAGYLGRPEETAAALVGGGTPASEGVAGGGGWFRTGDLGTKDEDGFLRIVDRKKDLIIRGGFNVYPREVEEALLRHPGIAEAAVIGLPHPTHGEEVCAVVIRDRHADPAPTAAEIIDWSRERLAKYKYPRRVEFVDAYPLGPSHKVLKRELRARFADGAA